jgi:hypothetical protein
MVKNTAGDHNARLKFRFQRTTISKFRSAALLGQSVASGDLAAAATIHL